ncbi:MAG: hypothetical protein H0V34_08290 [Gammaproteobacteria bacterium]|nr:hypothetical protein [Gammaproteobacteria bacterium]
MKNNIWFYLAVILGSSLSLTGCGGDDDDEADVGSDGPQTNVMPTQPELGDAVAGRDVFRFATFGNEFFWTDAVRLQEGILATDFTPLDLLRLGLSVDFDALDIVTQNALRAELATDLSPANAPMLNDVNTTLQLISANAVIGLAPKDTNGDGAIDVATGDKTGATCALCHTIADRAVFNMPGGGSIGSRLDGRAPHTLDFGGLVALGTNSRAFYPVLQLALDATGGATLGRSPEGLTEDSTEADADAYLTNKTFYPRGMFDDTVDGNGDPMHNMPLFRQDLAFPFGSEGALSTLDNFSNLVYTALLDPTNVTSPGGRAFVTTLGGAAAGNEVVNDYLEVLAETGVTGFPYIEASPPADPAAAGTEDFPLGVRVDNTMLINMNAYLVSLEAPPGADDDVEAVERGRQLFRTVGCTGCHNVDQSRFVPPFIVAMETIFPGDDPDVLLARRTPPLNPTLNTPGNIVENPVNIFDDKMAVVNASIRGLERGTGLPLLLDLARKPVFLHDNSVTSLDDLLDPASGATAPHPFFLPDTAQRADMIEFLGSLDTD